MDKNKDTENLTEEQRKFLIKSIKKTLSTAGNSAIKQLSEKGSISSSTRDLIKAALRTLSLLT